MSALGTSGRSASSCAARTMSWPSSASPCIIAVTMVGSLVVKNCGSVTGSQWLATSARVPPGRSNARACAIALVVPAVSTTMSYSPTTSVPAPIAVAAARCAS